MKPKLSIIGILLFPVLFIVSCQDSKFTGGTAAKPPKSLDGAADANDGDAGVDRTDQEDNGEEGSDDADSLGDADGTDSDLVGDEDLENGIKSGDAVKDLFRVNANKNKVDVLLFFDQSGSMQKYISEVAQRLGSFIDKFTQSKKALDYRIVVVAKDYNLTVQNDKVGHARISIGNHNAIDVFRDLITGKQSTGTVKLRKSSVKEFIVVSNDNSSQTSEEFGTWARSNRNKVGRIHINGFIGFKSTGPLGYLGPCYIDKAGTNYIEMTKNKNLGGLVQDMCTGNWDTLIDNLGKKITDVATNVFDLSEEPAGDVVVKVNDKVLPKSGWSYSSDDNSVEITAALNPDDKIIITYTKK